MEFIRINNRNNFLISEVESYHPQSIMYSKYWKRHKKRCIEGFWSIDDKDIIININEDVDETIVSEKWRFMPGNNYFYVNFGTILHQDEDGPKTAPKIKMRPALRDIEWEFYYNWLEARGFSGFDKDEKYTSNRELLDAFNGERVTFDKSCFNSNGKLKDFIPAKDYLRQLHGKPKGKALYQNEARNLLMLGARGFGKSYLVGVGVVLHEIIFDGAKEYTEETIKNPYKVEVFVGAAIAAKSADILDKTKVAMENLPGAWGVNTKDYKPSPFYKQMSGTLAPNNMKNSWKHEYQKKTGGIWKTQGSGSNVKHGIYTTENPEAAAGTRPGVMVVEEVGLCSNILTVHGSNTACQKEGIWKFGSSVYLGTGGNVEKVQETEILFRDPAGFDFLEFEDDLEGMGKTGWFVPCIYAMNQFKDENGNTDTKRAYDYKLKERERKRKSKDPSALALEMMNYPLVPSEMFLNAKDSMFPIAELKEQLANVLANPYKFTNSYYYVDLIWTDSGKLKIEYLNQHGLEIDYPIKDNKNRPGVICLFELPKKDINNEAVRNRYIQGTDTYDDDESSTNSLGSTWIMDMFTGRLVAEYTGRRGTKEFYEITRKLNSFYNAKHNYEQNKKGLFTYYDQKNSTHLLCDTPESLRDIADITISKIGNKRKGTNASTPVIAHGLRLILDWLLEPAYGEDLESNILNLHKIGSIGLLKELINYAAGKNADRVSALIMLMILRNDEIKFIEKRQADKVKDLSNDDFFTRNYKTSTKNKVKRQW